MARSSFRVVVRVAVATLLAVSAGLVALPTPAANAVSPNIVISQVYGGGGNAGSTLTNDFIELFNRGASAQSVTGWSVQYAAAAGTTWQKTDLLTFNIQPGQHYLVQEAVGAGGTTPLPTPDATGTIAMSATAGKVALVNTTTLIASGTSCPIGGSTVDFVEYGTTANCADGGVVPPAAATPAPSNTTTVLRGGSPGGCTDTDANQTDFTAGAPNPRNSPVAATPCTGDAAPSVSSTNPTSGAGNVALNSDISLTFSEPVNLGATPVTISGITSGAHTYVVSGGPSTFTVNPDSDFVNSETVTVTVDKTQVSDQDAVDPPDNMAADYVFSFQSIASDIAPTVSTTNPADNAGQQPVDTNIDVTFSEPVNAGGTSFTIGGSSSGAHTFALSGGPTTFTLNPDADFAGGENVTVTVVAANVTDQDTQDPPDNMAADYVFKFGTPLRIHDIQAAAHLSPYNGQTVLGVPGIVTARRANGFYLQEPDATVDADPDTSEGIFVFTSSAPTVAVGDAVGVSGTLSEFRAGGAASASLTNTEITTPGLSIVTISTGNPLPAPVVVGTGGRMPPSQHIDDDAVSGSVENGSTPFDPANDGIDFWESLEFMRVQLNDAHVVGPSSDFGSNREVPVVGDNGANASILTPRGGILLRQTDNNPERIILNDVITGGPTLATTVDVGDSYPGATVGVLDYNFNNFKLEVTSIPPLLSGGIAQEVTTAPAPGQLAVASFNLENLDPGDPASKFQDLANEVVTNLRSPDLIGLEEVQDNNGATDNGVVDASTTLNMFVAAIQAAGGPAYQFREIDPVNDQDGGEPGGNIRVAFLFRTDRGLSIVDRPGGTSTAADAVQDVGGAPQLLYSPGRIAPADGAWNSSRKPLAAEFTYGGSKLFVVVNHFNSKGGDDPLWGRFQPPTLVSESQRVQQAALVNQFTDQIETIDPTANVIVLGDLNDFSWSNPLQTLTAGGVLQDLVLTLPQDEQYSYVFEGNTQELDHLLASPAMAGQMALYDPVHINAEFAPQVSDHDPLVALFAMTPPRNCTVSGGPGDQTIDGTPGPDHICGRAGNDTIDGKGGNDVIDGGAGNDTILGGSGADLLLGKKGVDTITGGPGSDQIKGGYGNDTLSSSDGVQGNDSTDGGKGTDSCTADPGDVTQHCP